MGNISYDPGRNEVMRAPPVAGGGLRVVSWESMFEEYVSEMV